MLAPTREVLEAFELVHCLDDGDITVFGCERLARIMRSREIGFSALLDQEIANAVLHDYPELSGLALAADGYVSLCRRVNLYLNAALREPCQDKSTS